MPELPQGLPEPTWRDNGPGVVLYCGDCLDVLAGMPDVCVDSVVTDPPYGIRFMAKKWDYDVPTVDMWRECLRVLKPGGHLLSFAGTRTQHRMAVNIEDAGFDIRDLLCWVYGSGFPKSHDVSKAIDKLAGAKREVVGEYVWPDGKERNTDKHQTHRKGIYSDIKTDGSPNDRSTTAPATEAAEQYEGWGTGLSPALEPITLARKPLDGTVAANVLKHGTGGLNINGTRIKTGEDTTTRHNSSSSSYMTGKIGETQPKQNEYITGSTKGRWPSNLLHNGSDEVLAVFPETGPGNSGGVEGWQKGGYVGGKYEPIERTGYDDSGGSAARYFYCAKASKEDRDEGLDGMPAKQYSHDGRDKAIENPYQRNESKARNNHPTVKPTDLMRYLCRLITPPGGIILDPFMGSGSTGKAAVLEGFGFIGIDKGEEWMEIASKRIERAALIKAHEQTELF